MPADGRIVAASALQIDESALTGESVLAAKDAMTLSGDQLGPGDQTNMAFMNTPVTHGSGTVIVTGKGAGTELGKISGMLSATATEQSPLTKELNTLTLWIAAAAGLTMIVMFALGRARRLAWDALFVSAVSLAIAAIPEALPTVTQVILSLGSVDLAKRSAIVKDLPSVATLGFTSAINSDKRHYGHSLVVVRGASARALAAEAPEAYKDVTQVVAAAEGAGLCRAVARLVPLGVVKG